MGIGGKKHPAKGNGGRWWGSWQEALPAIVFGGVCPCRLIHAKNNIIRLIRRERKRAGGFPAIN
jgi:hypothetical protein